jgi:hypothetical protein
VVVLFSGIILDVAGSYFKAGLRLMQGHCPNIFLCHVFQAHSFTFVFQIYYPDFPVISAQKFFGYGLLWCLVFVSIRLLNYGYPYM